MSEFWAMGGYGGYVWSAFGLSALILIYNLWLPIYRHAKLLQQWRNQQQEEQVL